MLKKLQRTTLLLIATLTCSLGLINHTLAASNSTATKATPSHQIHVYYLHNTFRCFSCNSVGDLTRIAVLGGEIENPKTGEKSTFAPAFQDLIGQGKLSFSAINIDDSENHHLLTDFHTRAKFPVVVEIKNGQVVRYKVLNEAWKLLYGPQDKFVSYIQENVREYTEDL